MYGGDYSQFCADAADHRRERIAEAEWRARDAAERFEESGGLVVEALTELRRVRPWLFGIHGDEPGDRRDGDDAWVAARREGCEPPVGREFPGWHGDAA